MIACKTLPLKASSLFQVSHKKVALEVFGKCLGKHPQWNAIFVKL